MASLDLGTLIVGVKAEGADKAKDDLRGVETAAKGVEKSSDTTGKSMKVLSGSFSDSIKNSKLFGNSLGGLSSALTGGAGASAVLGGAVGGLTVAFAQMAQQLFQQALKALWEFGKQSIQVASDLEESANVVNVVFGEDNPITKWSQDAASAFNLSTLEAQKFAGTMGAVLTPSGLGKDTIEQMSMSLTQLSGDLGSLWNTSTEQAFNALRSGITGEMEPLKQFGIVMSQTNLEAFAMANGIEKSWKEMSQAEQATLRYNYILENTKTSQGDAARTADGYANSSKQLSLVMENMSNALGSKLLPGLASIKQSIADFIGRNKEMFELIGNIIGAIIDYVALAIKSFVNSPFIQLAGKILNWAASVVNGLIDGVRGLMQAWDSWLDTFRIGEDTAKGVSYEMVDMAKVSKEAMSGASGDMVDSFKEAGEGIKGELDIIKGALDEYYDQEEKKYKESLEKRFGNTKAGLIKQAEYMARFQEQQARKREQDEEAETRKLEQEEKKRADIRGKYSSGGGNGYTSNRNANGTLSARGGWTVVGETGRELMYVDRGSKIINNSSTEQILGGNSGNTFTGPITVVANNPNEFIEQMQQIIRSGGRLA